MPKINDITTDLTAPPSYMGVNFIRSAKENSVIYKDSFKPIQMDFYQEVKPAFFTRTKLEVYDAVSQLVAQRGWSVVVAHGQVGVLEATARTPIFGFRDDVIIRLTEEDDGITRVDMRSSSRIGRGDFGLNAERIISFMDDLENTLDEPLATE
ncbi:DUF1499 domain-containing protein [Marinomonas sp. C2222]|uniref:DUF1499 domain-containing protein n=1 Tax=Marinomonas sargassi TaxID=2984494 RepID=A0ABT2YSN3_9GAMM|nr:DUF1499 domain-containing protein [Marinomonas sargassi]MCV2402644.1 DUF1499 domain-containing protein [Marinomonas sargassi]